jgi:hypothetical protein
MDVQVSDDERDGIGRLTAEIAERLTEIEHVLRAAGAPLAAGGRFSLEGASGAVAEDGGSVVLRHCEPDGRNCFCWAGDRLVSC